MFANLATMPSAPTPTTDWFTQNAPPNAGTPVSSTQPPSGGGTIPLVSVDVPISSGTPLTQDQVIQLVGANWNNPQALQQLIPQLQAGGVQIQNIDPTTGQPIGGRDARPRFLLPDGTTLDIGDQGPINRGNIGNWSMPGAGGGTSGGSPYGGFGSLTFQPPSLADAENSPGYQFALQQGLKGIENSAASRGDLLTGGTLKTLQGYGTGLADQTYQNVFNRALQTQQTQFGDLYNLASLGKPA
jgi:hypothetical protein